MQPSVYGEEYLHGIAGVQRRSLHIPAALHRKLSILAGASRNGTVTLEGFINHLVSRHLEEYRETVPPGPIRSFTFFPVMIYLLGQ